MLTASAEFPPSSDGPESSRVNYKVSEDGSYPTGGQVSASAVSSPSASGDATSEPPTSPTSTASVPHVLLRQPPCPTNSKKSRKKTKKGKPLSVPPVTRNASTIYDPPPLPVRHCRLCHASGCDDSTAIAHLLKCPGFPRSLLPLRTNFFVSQAKRLGIPMPSLLTHTALFLTSHPVGEFDPPSTGSTVADLVADCLYDSLGDDVTAERYHSDLSLLIRNLASATLKHLKLNPTDSLDMLFYHPDIDPLLHDLDEPLDAYHPFDDLYPHDHHSVYDDSFYDVLDDASDYMSGAEEY